MFESEQKGSVLLVMVLERQTYGRTVPGQQALQHPRRPCTPTHGPRTQSIPGLWPEHAVSAPTRQQPFPRPCPRQSEERSLVPGEAEEPSSSLS